MGKECVKLSESGFLAIKGRDRKNVFRDKIYDISMLASHCFSSVKSKAKYKISKVCNWLLSSYLGINGGFLYVIGILL
jgi:hypothetical protein